MAPGFDPRRLAALQAADRASFQARQKPAGPTAPGGAGDIGAAIGALRGQLGGGMPAASLPGPMPTKPLPAAGGQAGPFAVAGGQPSSVTGPGLTAGPSLPAELPTLTKPGADPAAIAEKGGAVIPGIGRADVRARVQPSPGPAPRPMAPQRPQSSPTTPMRLDQVPNRTSFGPAPNPAAEVLQAAPPATFPTGPPPGALPPRLQQAVAAGRLDPQQAAQRFAQFQAGQLPGQQGMSAPMQPGGGEMPPSGPPMAASGPFPMDPMASNPGAYLGDRINPALADRLQAITGGGLRAPGNVAARRGAADARMQELMRQYLQVQGGGGMHPGALATPLFGNT